VKTWIQRLDIILSILIVLDIIFLIGSFLVDLNVFYLNFILLFDTALCLVLILTFIIKIAMAEDRKDYFRKNYLDLIASVPLDLLLAPAGTFHFDFVNVVILIRFLRMLLLFKESFKYLRRFFNATYLDKIIAIFIVVIVGSTFALEYFDPTIPNLYYSSWFVFQTITTVGYGDVIPKSPIGQLIAMILLIVGVLMFSILTASFAYLFNDKVFKEENEEFNEKLTILKKGMEDNKQSIEEIKERSISSNEDIMEIKERLKKNEESIKNLEENISYLIELVEKKK